MGKKNSKLTQETIDHLTTSTYCKCKYAYFNDIGCVFSNQ